MRKAVIAFILGFVVIVGWYFGSPQWTLGQMQSAAGANDTERLATYIDFAALRESVKSEVKAQITTKVMASNNGFDAIGGFVAMGMVDGMVDAMVNPAMMRNAFAAKTADIQQGEAPFAIKAEGAEFVRDRFDQFRLRHTGRADLVFERRGLGWMLVGIRAPVDRVAAAPDDSATPPHEYHSETQDAQAMPADPATVSPENLDLKHVAEAFADPCVGHYLNERNDPSMSAYSARRDR